MKRNEPYILHVYRLEPGDGPNTPPIMGDLLAAEEQASKIFLLYSKDKLISDNKRPNKAQLTHKGKVVLRLRVIPGKKVERVDERDMLDT